MGLKTPRTRTGAESRLDAIARGLAGGMSRRDALRLGGAAVVGITGLMPADAWALTCPTGRVRCAGKCCPVGEVCLPPAQAGAPHHCGCAQGLTRCGSQCVNLRNNSRHCGTCTHVCPTGQHCSAGKCVCAPGHHLCSGQCVSLSTDPKNCGSCGHACAAGETCQNSTCMPMQCPTGMTNCSGTCVNTLTDFNNCGGCGEPCSNYFAQSVCSNGQCQIKSCSPNWINCSGNPRDGCNCLGTTCNGNQCAG
jgi:hypothetical protein